jgi:hypothetical protein
VEDRERLGRIVAEADVLVQPGRPDAFNDYRFPSKLPDFFASGKPVVLPRTNIGLVTRHGEDAYVLDNADGVAIAEAVAAIMSDGPLRARLASGARTFYERQPTWSIAARRLAALYERILALPARRRRPEALTTPQAASALTWHTAVCHSAPTNLRSLRGSTSPSTYFFTSGQCWFP